jgi:hypothetical protein
MPKKVVDYSNTIIYKIYCKDESITDLYVGHTTNFIQRKYSHKIACNNLNNDLKIYNVIRSNGGWENWNMVEIAKYDCKDVTEARIKEQEHYNALQASLNSCPAYVDIKKYFCYTCNLQCKNPKQYNLHIKCNKHIKKYTVDNNEATIITKKNDNMYCCELCNFKTCKLTDFNRHLNTNKHICNKNETNVNNTHELTNYKCEICEKEYNDRTGLWRHKKKCNKIEKINNKNEFTNDEPTDKQLIMMLIKENSDLKNLVIKVLENGTMNNSNNNNNTNTNSHNKAFNLNFFLNETCKNAMNITDFVDSIKLQLSDLMDVGELGYVEGISKIIVKNLNNLDETIRPIHCTDKKRETMYIKDEGEWTKEDEKKSNLKKVINKVADKNIRLLPAFREKYPEYKNAYSKISDKYDKLVIEVMETDEEKKEKIIKNISKVTTIAEK